MRVTGLSTYGREASYEAPVFTGPVSESTHLSGSLSIPRPAGVIHTYALHKALQKAPSSLATLLASSEDDHRSSPPRVSHQRPEGFSALGGCPWRFFSNSGRLRRGDRRLSRYS